MKLWSILLGTRGYGTTSQFSAERLCFLFADCSDGDIDDTGIFEINPTGGQPFSVFCQREAGDMWTVIQQRFDGSTDFNRNWAAYRDGFGDVGLTTNYWLV